MQWNKLQKKLIASLLIFTMTFANFSIVTKSYAAGMFESIFGSESDTGNKNIEFEAFFETDGSKEKIVNSDVNNTDLAIKLKLNVLDSGYLKNAKVEVLEGEEGKGLNFEIGKNSIKENSERIKPIDETEVSDELNSLDNLDNQEDSQNEIENADENISETEENISKDAENLNNEIEETEELDEEVIEKLEPIEEEEIEFPEYVETLEDNVLYLSKIDSVSNINIDIPIKYKNEAYVNIKNISSSCIIKFSGIYIDGQGKEIEVEKEETLKVNWKDNRKLEVETGITKYIDYGQGIVLQTAINLDSTIEGNRLPIKNTELKVGVPILAGKSPENVLVVANSLEGTTGEKAGSLNFNESNWNYNKEENRVEIYVNNKEKLVKESEYSDSYVKENEENEENRIFNSNGVDEFLITYTYPGVSIEEAEKEIVSNINAKILMVNNMEVVSKSDYEYKLGESQGNLASFELYTFTDEISKAYCYMNYKTDKRYEVEIANSSVINISYEGLIKNLKLEDVSNIYIDKVDNEKETEDIFYKKIEVNKNNFDAMLGEEGEIKVTGPNGEVVAIINNTIEANEDGCIEVNIDGRYSKLNYEISKPISAGNIVINTVKAINTLSIDKESLVKTSKIGAKAVLKANYEYVENEVLVEEKTVETKLKDTYSNAKITMDRSSLSTLSENEDVEIRIQLNNSKPQSDIFGHSVFEVELPEYIENLDITNANILYGEGLNITEIVAIGRVLRITIDGVQDGINSGIITNGTNIVINANIKVNLYTPAKSEDVKLRYVNDEATCYLNNGVDTFNISYSAPKGMVAVNGINGFNGEESKIQSVRQGKQTAIVDIYSESKIVTEEIVAMNNYETSVSNVSILGRFPYKGVKDITTGEDLETTLDVNILSYIVADERNNTNVKIYYSKNEEADKNLTNELNGWVENPESLVGMKSYLIVPEDGYEMKESDVLRFTYQYEVPSNLEHNEKIAGTFVVNYTNSSDVLEREETEEADIVEISTGEGPELEFNLVPDKYEVKEYEELTYTLNIKNIGKTKLENIVAEIPVPDGTEYIKEESENENISKSLEERNRKLDDVITNDVSEEAIKELEKTINNFGKKNVIVINIQNIEINSEENINLKFKVKNVNMVKGIINDNGELEFINLEEFPETYIKAKVSITAKDLEKKLEINAEDVLVKQAILMLEEEDLNIIFDSQENIVYEIGKELNYRISLKNFLNKNINNLKVVQELPNEVKFIKCSVSVCDYEKQVYYEQEGGTFDEGSNSIIWQIDNFYKDNSVLKGIYLNYTIKIDSLAEGVTKDTLELSAIAETEEYGTQESNSLYLEIGKPLLVITQISENTNTYIKSGDIVKYTFLIRNEGGAKANNIELKDVIPSGMLVHSISYKDPVGNIYNKSMIHDNPAVTIYELNPNEEIVADVELKASYNNLSSETSVTNYGVLSADINAEVTSNSITHIIEKNAGEVSNKENETIAEETKDNIVQTYKIEGLAFEDANKDGMRNTNEKLLSGISVKLLNSDGIVEDSTQTDESGEYSFIGISNGNYLVIFEYDNLNYMVTTYRKEGVSLELNSDAISTKLEQNGKVSYGAITDTITIANSSVSNIDIGLTLAEKFDLKIDKTITKIITQTSKGTTTENYKNLSLAKTEIAGKNIAGAVVYVEYEIKVSNVGDIKGYAKKIVDYIPKGMKFNSSLDTNKDWYTGPDGNLYSTKLENEELSKGESRTLKLVLTKEMTTENTGINNNQVEIYEDYNIYGITDTNSIPGNKKQNENDLSSADAVILIKTGNTPIYITTIIFLIIIGIIIGPNVNIKKLKKKKVVI